MTSGPERRFEYGRGLTTGAVMSAGTWGLLVSIFEVVTFGLLAGAAGLGLFEMWSSRRQEVRVKRGTSFDSTSRDAEVAGWANNIAGDLILAVDRDTAGPERGQWLFWLTNFKWAAGLDDEQMRSLVKRARDLAVGRTVSMGGECEIPAWFDPPPPPVEWWQWTTEAPVETARQGYSPGDRVRRTRSNVGVLRLGPIGTEGELVRQYDWCPTCRSGLEGHWYVDTLDRQELWSEANFEAVPDGPASTNPEETDMLPRPGESIFNEKALSDMQLVQDVLEGRVGTPISLSAQDIVVALYRGGRLT